MEEKFGVSAAAPVAAAAPAASGGDAGGEAEADDAPVDIHLTEVGDTVSYTHLTLPTTPYV